MDGCIVPSKDRRLPQSTVVLDLHGEYASAFGDEANVISGAEIELP